LADTELTLIKRERGTPFPHLAWRVPLQIMQR
jgi:hypothetical protein